jgi:hypothetical protein
MEATRSVDPSACSEDGVALIVIDCGGKFWSESSPEEQVRLFRQLRCTVHAAAAEDAAATKTGCNRRSRLVIAGFSPDIRDAAAAAAIDTSGWPIMQSPLADFLARQLSLTEAIAPVAGRAVETSRCSGVLSSVAQAVYLSPDATDTLSRPPRPGEVFCIGGLADCPERPGAALRRVAELRAAAATAELRELRLPIAEALPAGALPALSPRGREGARVLSVNAAAAALLRWRRTGDWAAALAVALPRRLRFLLRPPPPPPAAETPSDRAEARAAATAPLVPHGGQPRVGATRPAPPSGGSAAPARR